MKQLNEHQTKWLANLTSGEYKRAMHRLHLQNEAGQSAHCCLGVHLVCQPGITWRPVTHSTRPYMEPLREDGSQMSASYLGQEHLAQLDLNVDDQNVIAEWNDSISTATDPTFDEIVPRIKELYRTKGYDVPE